MRVLHFDGEAVGWFRREATIISVMVRHKRYIDDIVSEAASAVISNLFCSGAVLSGEYRIVENVLNLSSARPPNNSWWRFSRDNCRC